MHDNKISTIDVGTFQNMPTLKRIRLDGNYITCDCSLLWLTKVLKEKPFAIETAIICKYPEKFNGKNVKDLNESDLDCSKSINFIKYNKLYD